MKRVGIVAIVIKENRSAVSAIQDILSDHHEIIIGRMGIPDRINNIHMISLAVEGETEKISALTGKLGRLNNVAVKSAVTTVEL
ncbi:MAG: TM1266 family iron-only hydrogenase system putative regulator [Clostridia bacterium]